jgi:nucleotide-binding universal stress UspA family protein
MLKCFFVAFTRSPHALATFINQSPAGLMLPSVFGGPRLRQWLLGDSTRSVVERTRNPVVMFRI